MAGAPPGGGVCPSVAVDRCGRGPSGPGARAVGGPGGLGVRPRDRVDTGPVRCGRRREEQVMTSSNGSIATGSATGRGGCPTFSVILPTYNRCDVVRQTLTQLIAQDYPSDRFEILVCD